MPTQGAQACCPAPIHLHAAKAQCNATRIFSACSRCCAPACALPCTPPCLPSPPSTSFSALSDCLMGLKYDPSLMRCALRVATCYRWEQGGMRVSDVAMDQSGMHFVQQESTAVQHLEGRKRKTGCLAISQSGRLHVGLAACAVATGRSHLASSHIALQRLNVYSLPQYQFRRCLCRPV